jgi:flagellar biogenesis protein FliO
MSCGWDSPEQIAVCIHLATRWFTVFVDIVGLGSFALIVLLTWLFRRLRKDLATSRRKIRTPASRKFCS